MSKFIGDVSAYAYAVSKGYTGTEEEFAELMASYATVGQTAVTAAQTATTKASEAATSATTATNKASEATTAAQTATTKASDASTSASTATSAKDTAVSASQTATSKASEATTAAETANTAKNDAVTAKTAAETAQGKAEDAQAAAEAVAESIPSDYSQLSEDVTELKSDLTTLAPKEDMLKAFPTDTASGSVASFDDGANVPVKSLIVNIDPVQEGSGDPSPDNVRPISGWSEVNVQRTGKNLFDVHFDNTISDNSHVYMLKLKPNTQYTCSSNLPLSTIASVYFGGGSTNINGVFDGTPKTMTTDANGNIKIYIRHFTSDGGINMYQALLDGTYWVQVEEGATATPYEPCSGQSINIALGQTVYGGTLNVVSGELVIDRAMVDLGTLAWTDNGTDSVYTPMLKNKLIGGDNCVCSALAKVAQGTPASYMPDATFKMYTNSVDFAVKLSGIASRNAQTMLSGFQFVYPLAAPLTIQLAPHEVTALLGSNNVWADTGGTAVEYRADPTLYIQRLTEPDADMVADSNITSGQYFMVGNTLYKATANIASGAAISPNVNCTRKSLSEALNELNA